MGHTRLVVLLAAALSTCPAAAAIQPDRLVGGSAAPQGATLVAGDQGARYELRGGATLTLAPGSEYAFEPSVRLKLRKPGEPDTLTRAVRIVQGRADVSIPPAVKDMTAVVFRTSGKLSAVAKEGRSTFVVKEDRTTVASREGEMLVGIGNDWKPLKVGFARTLAPEDPTAQPRKIIETPAVAVGAPLVVVRGGAAAHVSATWPGLKDATTYEVTLTQGSKLVSVATVASPDVAFDSLGPGAYSIQVAAVDRQGLPGNASPAVNARVLGVETPAGASASEDGTIVLGRDQRVSLVAADGIEVSYGSSSLFAAAPTSIGLSHGETTVARLRAAGSKNEALLRLEPSGLRANVTIGPRAARWPADRVLVQVALYDNSNHEAPADAEVKATVTVNLEPVAVRWERKGATLQATLPAAETKGPWIVRAEVRDARDELIGRDFLEVAPPDERRTTVARR